jgi:predicted RNase H-like nuclease
VSWTVVGVDCATKEERIGLAYGVVQDGAVLELKRATLGTAGESPATTIAGWIAEADNYVIAFDAPLGWPVALSSALAQHRAGDPIEAEPERLFRRDTDRFVHRELGKLPLEVGADRIARTARSALELLQAIRTAMHAPLALCWLPGRSSGAIEVYPAATLISRGISATGYKGDSSAGRKARAAIAERLSPEMSSAPHRDLLVENDHLLDAVICTLAAADFARGQALSPENRDNAEREGWIWFRGRGQQKLSLG